MRSDLITCGAPDATRVVAMSTAIHWVFSAATSNVSLVRLFILLSCVSVGSAATPSPEKWVPIRWTGGPMELAWRTHVKTLPTDAPVRDAIARWYDPATLNLLDQSPANCLLVTWSAPSEASVEAQQRQLVTAYAEAAHERGLAVLGLVYAVGDASKITTDAAKAALDGLVLEGDFPPEFSSSLRKAAGSMMVIEIAKDASSARWKSAPITVIAGVMPSGRNLSEMGIRGAPSSQPWIESNIWLARSFPIGQSSRTLWISSQLESPSAIDYVRTVADAAAAGGRWIISLDDALRAKLRAGDGSALETWQRLNNYLKFAESHAEWRSLPPYGNVAIVVDPATTAPDITDEYLKLTVRRQIPYRIVARSELNAATLSNYRVVVAIELDSVSATERKVLQDFAGNGGVVVVGPSWGGAPTTEAFAERPVGKGSVFIYKDPDPESVAHDLKEVLSDDDLGIVPFNVPSVITSASGEPGKSLLVQLVNYFDHPVEAITLRLAGTFHSAHLETPEGATVDLPLRTEEGKTEVTIPKLLLWGAVSMQ